MHRIAFWATGVIAWGCGGGTVSIPSDPTEAVDGGSSVDSGDARSSGDMPPACANTNPFGSEDCGVALQERCHTFANERDCSSAPDVVLGYGAYNFICGWAKVVRFADVSTCTVAATEGRCEAYITQGVGCGDPCGETGGGLYDSLMASVERRELVQNPCSSRGADGPIGRGTALVNQQGQTREWHPCGTDISPPPPAELCACVATACAQ